MSIDGTYTSTSYGPPWNSLQGSGVTSRGTKLAAGPTPMKGPYVVAVDPYTIPYGTLLEIWPNPFNRRGPFLADDTGGAFLGKGRKIDFYNSSGRAGQYGWGVRQVQVKRVGYAPAGYGRSRVDLVAGNDAPELKGSILGDIGDAVGDVAGAVTGPVGDVAGGVSSIAGSIGEFVSRITSGQFWKNTAMVFGGFVFIILSLGRLSGAL